MEMIYVPRTEIAEEIFSINDEDDFAWMIEELLGYEAGKYVRKMAEKAIGFDGLYDMYDELETEVDDLETKIKTLKETKGTFVFVKE